VDALDQLAIELVNVHAGHLDQAIGGRKPGGRGKEIKPTRLRA
jgi:hypothetical protein